MYKVIVFSVGAEGVEPSLMKLLPTRCAVCGSVAPCMLHDFLSEEFATAT